MPLRSKFPPFVLAPWILALAVGGGCKKESDKPAEGTTDAARTLEGEGAAAEPAEPAPRAKPKAPRVQATGEILGHVRVPNFSGFLTKLQSSVLPAQAAAVANEGMLRMMLGGQLGNRAQLAQNLALDKPMGCAVVSPKVAPQPVVCAFDYKGGLDQLQKDLGAAGKQADAAGHAAHYVFQGTHVYLDALGDHVAASLDPGAFAPARAYLETQVLGRAGQAGTDLEIVVYPVKIRAAFAEEIDAALDALTVQATTSKEIDDPKVRKAVEIWSAYNQRSTRRTFERVLSWDQATVGIGLDDQGAHFRATIFPAEGSEFARDLSALFPRPIDPAFVATMPAGGLFALVTRQDRRAGLELPSSVAAMKAVAEAYAALRDSDPKKAYDTYMEWARKGTAHLGPSQGLVVFSDDAVPLGFLLVQETVRGGIQDFARELFAKATPEAMLPEEARTYVTWRYEKDAVDAGDGKADRLVVEAGPKLAAILEKDAGQAAGKVRSFLGGWKIAVALREAKGRMYTAFGPGKEADILGLGTAAAAGKGATGKDGALAAILSATPHAVAILGLDVKGVLDVVRRLGGPDAQKVPADVGGGLTDVTLTGALAEGGALEVELAIRKALLDQVRTALQRESSG